MTDLVDSTGLRVRLGDRVADAVGRDHERLVRRCVARFGAERVYWLGDGVMAAFASASAAMQAGLAIQRGIELRNRRGRRLAELSTRVAVTAGEVERGYKELGGPPVERAGALCRQASGGELLSTPDTLELIGRRLELEPVWEDGESTRVLWKPPCAVSETLALPHALETEQQLPFVGRDRACSELCAGLDAVETGRPRIVSIRGDAGIGKTRLVAEFARRARERGAAILFGTCRADVRTANAPVAHALRGWLEAAEDVCARLGPNAGELARLVPKIAERAPGLDPPTASDAETERLRLYEAVAEWLVDASQDDPLVVILDSMHWASPETFALLEHALPALADSRVMLVAAHRGEDTRPEALLRSARDALGPAAAVTIALEGLEPSDLSLLLERMHRDDSQPQEVRLLHLATRGNPLHVNEILRSPPIPSLPDTIREALQIHLDRLGGEQKRIVEAAAVLGGEFEARLLAHMTGDPDATLEALDAAVAAGLLFVVDCSALRYRFSHDETRQTVIDAIGAGRLTRLHGQAGAAIEALEASDATLADLAFHFTAAAPLLGSDKALEYSERAARRAASRYENETAETLYRQALALLRPEQEFERWFELALGRGEVLRRIGDPGHRALLLELADRAHERGDGERMARALLTTYRGTFSRAMKVDEDYVARLRRAVDTIGNRPTATRARLLALLGVETAWAPDQDATRRIMNESVAVARRLGDPELLTSVLAHRQWVVFHPFSERWEDMQELAGLSERSSDPLLRFDVIGNEAFTRLRAGDREGLVGAMQRLRAAAEQADQPLVRWMLMLRESAMALMEGRFDDASRDLEEGRALALATGQPDAEAQHRVQRFWLDFDTQPVDRARADTHALVEVFERLGRLTAWSSIALRAAELGMRDDAARIVEAMRAYGFGRIPMDQRWLVTLCGLGAAGAAAGLRSAAEPLYSLLKPHAKLHANVIFTMVGSVERYLGLLAWTLGGHEAAEGHLRRSIGANRDLGAVTWLARSQLDYAAWSLEVGRFGEEARGHLDEASASVRRLGLPTLRERAERLTQRL